MHACMAAAVHAWLGGTGHYSRQHAAELTTFTNMCYIVTLYLIYTVRPLQYH